MALKHLLFLAISMTMMVGPQVVSAQQSFNNGRNQGPLPLPDEDLPVPGEPNRPEHPRPNPAPRPRPNPGRPPATVPMPGNPGQPGHGGYGTEQKVIYVQRRVMNERFNLFALAGINQRYQGCTVDSVSVNVMGSDIRTQMGLLINGNVDQWVNSPQRYFEFRPRYQAVIGQVRMMELDVRGMSDIQTIALNIRCNGNGGGYPNPNPGPNPGPNPNPGYCDSNRPGQVFPVQLNVWQRLVGNARFDLNPYFNWQQYVGYRLRSVRFDATSYMNVSYLDFAVNGVIIGRSQVGPWNQSYELTAQNVVIGQNAQNLVFFTQGDLELRNVTLFLEECGNNHPMPPQPPRPR